MYSKYLDYYEPGTKAHWAAQQECQEKDAVIGQLRGEVGELRQLEGDYTRLNELIRGLESKYSLLLAERDRAEKEQKAKTEGDRRSILDLRAAIDELRVQLQRSNLVIEDLLRENTGLKKQCDNRGAEIQAIRFEIKEIENKNQRGNDQNRALAVTLKGLKEERKRLEDVCQELSSALDAGVAKLKGTEKEVRSVESSNVRLEKILSQAERDNAKLVAEMQEKTDEKKRGDQKYRGLTNAINETGLTLKGAQQQTLKLEGELAKHAASLDQQSEKGRQLQGTISGVETSIRAAENELDIIISEEQRLRKDHFAALDRNKALNGEIDQVLALIAECEQVNRELVDEIELFSEQDKQARSMLDRGESMREIVEGALRKAALTEEPIRHLKC